MSEEVLNAEIMTINWNYTEFKVWLFASIDTDRLQWTITVDENGNILGIEHLGIPNGFARKWAGENKHKIQMMILRSFEEKVESLRTEANEFEARYQTVRASIIPF